MVRKASDAPEISARFELANAGFTVPLLGKDGGEKLRSARVVTPEALFRLIDPMPMRQQEAQSRRNQ